MVVVWVCAVSAVDEEEPVELASSGSDMSAKIKEPMATTTEMMSVKAISPSFGMVRILHLLEALVGETENCLSI